jgi:hypothetical protein
MENTSNSYSIAFAYFFTRERPYRAVATHWMSTWRFFASAIPSFRRNVKDTRNFLVDAVATQWTSTWRFLRLLFRRSDITPRTLAIFLWMPLQSSGRLRGASLLLLFRRSDVTSRTSLRTLALSL